jgi:hypothetical protein
MEISAPAVNASINAFVPDRAIVPKLFTKSAFVMPTPESTMEMVLFVLSGIKWMNNSGCVIFYSFKRVRLKNEKKKNKTGQFLHFSKENFE